MKLCRNCQHLTRQAMYIQRNIEARSRNHCCREKGVRSSMGVCLDSCLGFLA